MNKVSRILSIVLVVAVLCSTLSITSYASRPSDFVVENGVLTEYHGKDEYVIIPDNLGITKIGYAAFMHKNTMKFVKVPEGVTVLGESAFQNSNNLTSVELPSTLKIIEGATFQFCNNLVDIEIPQSVTYIGGLTFNNCHSLSSLAVPDGVTTLSFGTFANCPNLTFLLIPSSVAFISPDVFNPNIGGKYDDDEDPDTNPNVIVYVERGSFAESAMKQLNKTTEALDTIEKISKLRIPVTLNEITVQVDNRPTKFTTFNINGSNYFNIYDIKEMLKKNNKKYYTHIFEVRGGLDLRFVKQEPDYYWFYNVTNVKQSPIATSTASAIPKTINYNQTGYIVGNGCYMQIRDIAKHAGFTVSWNNKTKMISIDTSRVK